VRPDAGPGTLRQPSQDSLGNVTTRDENTVAWGRRAVEGVLLDIVAPHTLSADGRVAPD
jgi:hypothetical protein